MKFVTAEDERGIFVGLMNDTEDKVLPLKRAEIEWLGVSDIPDTMIECIEMGNRFIERISHLQEWIKQKEEMEGLYLSMDHVTLLAPIPKPKKNIFCVGKNYREHVVEMGGKEDIPENLIVFTKGITTVIGPNEPIENHKNITDQLDYEGELAIIIGKKGRDIPREHALDYCFGYTILNDITARDLQKRHKQFFLGKSLDRTCPIGPWIVHSSAIENPNMLDIETKVNEEVRQKGNTNEMMFTIEDIISTLSKGMTLEPGDIIATGTPAGVGKGMNPPKFLHPGDKITISIEKIGTLVNYISE